MDEDSRVDGQPAGFAQPLAAPLGGYASAALATISDAPQFPPQEFAVTGDPGPRLDLIAPAPPEQRDPNQPFEAGQGDQMPEAEQRDPRQPIVTASFAGTEDFAPPTGEPVGKWAPPTGAPAPWGAPVAPWPGDRGVSAIARSGSGAPPYQSSMPPAPMYRGPYVAPAKPSIQAQYAATPDGLAKFGIVMMAVPWFVLLMLLVGVFPIGFWSLFLLVVAWIVCTSQAKVAQPAMNRCFLVAAGISTLIWFFAWVTNNYLLADAYYTMLRWSCAILVIALPIVAWRGLERQ